MATLKVLIGAGGHADDIWNARPSHGFNRYGWTRVAHHSLLGPDDRAYIIGVNDPQLRARIQAELGGLEYSWTHPDAHVYAGVTVGRGTHINYAASVTRTTLGAHCTVAPGVTICGDVTVGDRVFIGAGAVICNLVTIGDDAVIGAGTIVLNDVPAGATVVGNPGRQIK